MTLEEFADLVRRMREEQKLYFRSRRESVLERCKRLEKEVDQAVDDIRRGPLNERLD